MVNKDRFMSPFIPEIANRVDIHVIYSARKSADNAAAHANVVIRPLTDLADFTACESLFDSIWRSDSGSSLMAKELLRGLSSANSYVAGAFQSGHLVGACVGFWGPPGSRTMHSHIAGVSGTARGRNVGYALKLDQRAHALENDADTITWTYDPLVRRNAFFNFHKLGGVASKYLVNYYGQMDYEINGTDESDRLLLEWKLASPGVVESCDVLLKTTPADMGQSEIIAGLVEGTSGQPVIVPTSAATLLVGVPADIENLRRLDPALGREWRAAVRAVLTRALSDGGRIDGFDPKTGSYIVKTGRHS